MKLHLYHTLEGVINEEKNNEQFYNEEKTEGYPERNFGTYNMESGVLPRDETHTIITKIIKIKKKQFWWPNDRDIEITKNASKNVGKMQYKPVEENGHPSYKLLVTIMNKWLA